MGDEILKKLDMFLDDDVSESRVVGREVKGMRPIQFMRFWGDFRPGDRVDVLFAEDFISLAGTNAEGHFAGIKKELDIDSPDEMEEFKGAEGKIWNFV
jgi:hypothetical protein